MKQLSMSPVNVAGHLFSRNNKTLFALTWLTIVTLIACSPGKNLSANRTKEYIPVDKALYDTIARQDSMLFAAFNSRNHERLMGFFGSGLELYQDNIGVRNYEETAEAFKGLFQKDYILTRKLVKGSLEVYPIKGYGAIETGAHTFCHSENGKSDCGTFRFLHVWGRENGQWKITRLITYDH